MDVETLHSDILSALASDPISQIHLADPPDSCWSTDEAGFLWLDSHIYVPDSDDLHLQVLQYQHDHPLAGHVGQNQTLELIQREYTWPGLRTFVKDYIWSCTSCTWAKTPHHRPYRLLKQLPVPGKPWNSLSMDFIEQLPSSTGFMAILVVVDQLSKQAIFIPTHNTITSLELAKLFLLHIFSKHGVPAHVTSDHSTEFVSHFFQCHTPNRFGTVNMEDNVNIKWSWCKGWAQWSLIIAIYRTRTAKKQKNWRNNVHYGMRKECNLLQSNSHTRMSEEAEGLMEKQRNEMKKWC